MDLSTAKVDVAVLVERSCEFPALHPQKVGRPYRYLYLGAAHSSTGNAPLQALLKRDLETGEEQLWSAAPHGFGGEPLFVPHPAGREEDDGWLLLWIYNAEFHRTELAILTLKISPLAQWRRSSSSTMCPMACTAALRQLTLAPMLAPMLSDSALLKPVTLFQAASWAVRGS